MGERDDVVSGAGARPRRVIGTVSRAAWRHPWAGAACAGVLGYVYTSGSSTEPGDFTTFVTAGRALVQGRLADVFASPQVQSGPLSLAPFGLMDRVIPGAATVVCVALLMSLVASFSTTATIRLCSTSVDESWAGGGLLAAWTLGVVFFTFDGGWAHPSHAIVPLLWVLTVRCAQSGRLAAAGAALGVAIGVDTWAVLGVCGLVVLLPDVRRLALAALTAAGIAVSLWAPFFLAGPVSSGTLTWPTNAGSLPALLGVSLDASYRLGQACFIVAAGTVLAIRLRRETDLAWLLPVVLVALRIATDGQYFSYYSVPVTSGVLAGLAVTLGRVDARALLVAPAAILVSSRPPLGLLPAALPMLVGVCLAVVAVCRPSGQLRVPAIARRART